MKGLCMKDLLCEGALYEGPFVRQAFCIKGLLCERPFGAVNFGMKGLCRKGLLEVCHYTGLLAYI